MNFTYYGHACFSVTITGKHLLFDPFITGNPLATAIDIESIKADYILVSHGHGDHVGDLLAIARNTNATIITNFEIANWVKAQGYDKVHPMNFGPYDFDFGKLHFVPATHSSALPDGSYGGNPGGFLIRSNEINMYYSGDTSLSMEMQLIPRYAQPDVAILPVGGNFTMGVEEALMAADFIKCDKVIGVHFDTFGYIVIDHEAARKRFDAAGKELLLPGIGESIVC
jgi:L-ascorbate metabolism protein UlaG (beta-lactamase superfamily)